MRTPANFFWEWVSLFLLAFWRRNGFNNFACDAISIPRNPLKKPSHSFIILVSGRKRLRYRLSYPLGWIESGRGMVCIKPGRRLVYKAIDIFDANGQVDSDCGGLVYSDSSKTDRSIYSYWSKTDIFRPG